MSGRRDPDWRDRASEELLLRQLSFVDLGSPCLLVEAPRLDPADALAARGLQVVPWDRRALEGRSASPWPPRGPFPTVILRLPPDKGELAMALDAAASVMAPEGTLLVYGAKDEGIQAAPAVMESLFTAVTTLGVGGHCRVLTASLRHPPGPIRGSLAAWREDVQLVHPLLSSAWVSFPGVFSHRRLDPGTRLLLGVLPDLPAGSRVLDYGCGSGVVGHAILAGGEGLYLDLLDVDAVALEAARENVPEARLLLRDGLPSPDEGPWDAIVSNPPFHRGKMEDRGMVLSLVEGAPARLTRGGCLVLVAQRRLALEGPLGDRFQRVSVLADDGLFRVWEGKGPRR